MRNNASLHERCRRRSTTNTTQVELGLPLACLWHAGLGEMLVAVANALFEIF